MKISASVVYKNIEKYLPTNERQLQDLAKANLSPNVQASTWQQAVEKADGKVPSGLIVKGIVELLKDKPLFFAQRLWQW